MSNQSYTKGCRDCSQQIRMQEVNGKWSAYNLDSGFHQCKKQPQQQPRPEVKEKEQPLTLDQIDVRLKRVEKMLFNQGT
jgi:hypothetical protein